MIVRRYEAGACAWRAKLAFGGFQVNNAREVKQGIENKPF
jgi:hypothetical protein